MGIINIDVGLGDLFEIGKSTKSLIRRAITNQENNSNNINNEYNESNQVKKLNGGNVVVKCPGCGHKSAINDGDGKEDRCEYCGTVIGN